MLVEYGPIRVEIERWQRPTLALFDEWAYRFLALEETRYFDIYLLGGFLDTVNGLKAATADVDVILTGCHDLDKIETLIVHGTTLGLERHQVFFDVLWFDHLPIYVDDPSPRRVKTYIASNQWIIDGEVRKTYPDAHPLPNSLWEMYRQFPTAKQQKLLDQGYTYSRPLRLATKTREIGEF